MLTAVSELTGRSKGGGKMPLKGSKLLGKRFDLDEEGDVSSGQALTLTVTPTLAPTLALTPTLALALALALTLTVTPSRSRWPTSCETRSSPTRCA